MTNPAYRGCHLPLQAGIGLKGQHVRDLLAAATLPAFVEIHAENYMGAGGPMHRALDAVRERLPLSVHGVGLSIGASEGIDPAHLARLARLLERFEPAAFSEHLAWSTHREAFLNDLLPVPYDAVSLQRVCSHVDQVQSVLKRRMLIENPSTYVEFASSTLGEVEFLGEVVRRTGCGLLLDVNNAYVSCVNHGRDPVAFIDRLPLHAVGEIHLAGFAEDRDAAGDRLLIDSHGSPVAHAVWSLYRHALSLTGPVPTLIEWDNDVPDFARLMDEARTADAVAGVGGAPARRAA